MTRYRVYGSDVPFCAWMRSRADLPSFGQMCGFVASDADVFIHRYLSEVDRLGTREIQSILFLEVKTRDGEPTDSQLDTLLKIHATTLTQRAVRVFGDQHVRNFGVAFLSMSGTHPGDSSRMRWGRFAAGKRRLRWQEIATAQLVQLLRFELHPDTLLPRPFRRHHQNNGVLEQERTPLGFIVDRHVTRRS